MTPIPGVIEIPARRWFLLCAVAAAAVLGASWLVPLGADLLAAELFAMILAVFVFGSTRIYVDKNSITYGMLLIVLATFTPLWWPESTLRHELVARGLPALWEATRQQLLTIHGLERLLHGDTMLFILGLTFFVSVISQTRVLETTSIGILRMFDGGVLPTTLFIAALVSLASGILDGVSMIGLTMRVFVIIFAMAKLRDDAIKFSIMAAVVLTTVCGMWLAYGEPPNLIMKSNLQLPNSFFLLYTGPMALVTYAIVALFVGRAVGRAAIPLREMDVLERRVADVRFLQAVRRGEVREVEELLAGYAERLGERAPRVHELYHQGHHPISAMVRAGVAPRTVHAFTEEYLGEEFVVPVGLYYAHRTRREAPGEAELELIEAGVIEQLLDQSRLQRRASQVWAALAFIPFALLLVWHANDHDVPLFWSSTAAFAVAFLGIAPHRRMRRLAWQEAAHEYREYLFLFPLFLSITMLTAVGFFDEMQTAIEHGVTAIGPAHVAVVQYVFAALLSAILDNNVVADFASRAIHGMPDVRVFAAAQIAGYAAGGSLTHIGCAQSVVAFAYILRNIDPAFTPFAWVAAMWRLVAAISLALIAAIYVLAALT